MIRHTNKRNLAFAAAFTAVAIDGGPALAAEPFTRSAFQVAGGGSYGLYVGEAAREIPSPYGLGLSARAGYTFSLPVYLGGEGNYFFGASQRFPEYGDVEGSLQIVHYGAEAGYDFGLLPSLILRPKVGVGGARVTATLTVEGITDDISETGLVLSGGFALLYGSQRWFIAGEARYTALNIDTEQLQNIPGIEVEDGARLDGLLFSLLLGITF